MHMAIVAKRWTVDDLHELPEDGRRHEIVDGELFMTPSPAWSHQSVLGALYVRFARFFATQPIGHVLMAPADVVFGPGTSVQPDLFIVPLIGGRKPASFAEAGRLLLAVEVLSPGSARLDRIVKRELYLRAGVPEYWIVDPDARVVERWRSGEARPEILDQRIEWPDGGGMVVELEEMFSGALD